MPNGSLPLNKSNIARGTKTLKPKADDCTDTRLFCDDRGDLYRDCGDGGGRNDVNGKNVPVTYGARDRNSTSCKYNEKAKELHEINRK